MDENEIIDGAAETPASDAETAVGEEFGDMSHIMGDIIEHLHLENVLDLPEELRGSEDTAPESEEDGEGSEDTAPESEEDGEGSGDTAPESEEDGEGSEDTAPESEEGGEGSGDADLESEEDGEGSEDAVEDIKGLPASAKKILEKRIGKEVGKRKDLEDKLSAQEARYNELHEHAENLRARLKDVSAGHVSSEGVHPAFIKYETEADLNAREDELWKFERWAERYRDEGYPGSDAENDPAWTAKDIRDALVVRREERDRILPQVRQLLRERSKMDEYVKVHYPDLLDSSSDFYRVYERCLDVMPALKRYPNSKILVGDMIAGQALREKRDSGDRTSKKSESKRPLAKSKQRAPSVPKAGSSVKSGLKRKVKKVDGVSSSAYVRSGGSKAALEKQAAALISDW